MQKTILKRSNELFKINNSITKSYNLVERENKKNILICILFFINTAALLNV